MGFEEGQIVLNSDNGTYFPGQMLSGRLEFSLDKVKNFRGIYAEVRGICKVHWTTRHSRRVNNRTQHYTVTHESYEEYINVTIYLIGSKSGEATLHPGRHVFPFECQIPPHCPSSFEGSEGSIRYSVKVTVDRAFKIDQTKIAAFRVEAPLDLNTNPHCKEPIAFEIEQSFCCWCMNAGLAETVVKLPAGGFCPKQIVPIEVACSNNSNVNLEKIKLAIKKTVTFEAQREPDRRSEESVIAELKKGPIPANTTRNWTVEMEIPDMDIPNLNNCRFISIDYRFKVDIVTAGCHTNEDESRPIFLGTIPLASLQYPPNSNFESAQDTIEVKNYPAPILNQPLPNGGYPGVTPYPGNIPSMGFNMPENPPYPTVMPYPVSPNMGDNPPYNPSANPPYVTAQHVNSNAPYPGAPQPYPGQNPTNPPYPNSDNFDSKPPYPNSPNVGSNPPYPNSPNVGSNPPYPNSPNVGSNPPYPNSPNIGSNPPYPTSPNTESNIPPQNAGTGFPSPYASSGKPVTGTGLKTGNIGFPMTGSKESMPLLPPGGALPYPTSPFASASAPPSTPDDENKNPTDDKPPYPM